MVSRKFRSAMATSRFLRVNLGMFPSQAFRARSLPVFDGVDERPVMLFRDGDEFPSMPGTVLYRSMRALGEANGSL